MGRSFGPPPWEENRTHRRSASQEISAMIWDLSAIMGRVAMGILALVLIVIAIRATPALRDRLLEVLPRPMAEFFRDEERSPAPEGSKIEEIRSKAVGALVGESERRESRKSAARLRTFGMGSTKSEVLSIQGSPTSRTDNTWYYGQSEVYFTADRVVGWRNSASNPLRVE